MYPMPRSLFPKERKGPNGRTLAWNISNTVKQNKSKKQTPLFALMKFSSLKELHSSPKCGDWGRYSDVASALMEAVLNGLATACLRCFDRQLPPSLGFPHGGHRWLLHIHSSGLLLCLVPLFSPWPRGHGGQDWLGCCCTLHALLNP